MWEKLLLVWKIKEVRNKILYVLALLVIFRLAAHLPIPGVNLPALRSFFQSNQFLGLLNIFSGGGFETFSVVMLGVGPYITASIIFQLLTMIIPALERLSKEGERGHQQINQWTRLLTVPLAALQAYGTITIIRRSAPQVIPQLGGYEFLTAIIAITAGTVFLMWLGELITEKKIGNGISLMIFAGIVAGVPTIFQRSVAVFDPTQLTQWFLFAAIGLVTVVAVVFVTEAMRKIPVTYARRVRGHQVYGGSSTFLPMRVNQAGVIPIIFAISLVLTPTLVAQFFVNSRFAWIQTMAQSTVRLFQSGRVLYDVIYFLLVFAFTYFYTAVVFKPEQISENLQKQGGFIPGLRPGRMTAEYLSYVSNRIILAGAFFLGTIAILPNIVQRLTNVTTLIVGGTSLLIVVSVVLETVKQIEAQLIVRDYEGF
ncbi:MAG: preprotein translocase subunit SecY [Candidatus Kerfeldbacteria bacterium]|nr:preprotein translocase subunit SecY [Candidatus Kerfeldbacteria bacterium]